MAKSLQDLLDHTNAVDLLRNQTTRGYGGPVASMEYSNWRDEQAALHKSAVFCDLSHHMTDINLGGTQAVRFISDFGVNSVRNLRPGIAKQLVVTSETGHVIGDGILDYVSTDRLNLATTAVVADWLQFHLETEGYDLDWKRDEPTATNPNHHPEIYRYQIMGPAAEEILSAALEGPLPEIGFFKAVDVSVGGAQVRLLGHNMGRQRGGELIGPWTDATLVRDRLFSAGIPLGLTPVGTRGAVPIALESGWFAGPLPAIYSGERLRPFREWLPADSYEATESLGGSFDSRNIEDFYFYPGEIGYRKIVKFDHDFVGRDALELRKDAPERRKVTLAWNVKDVLRVLASDFHEGTPFKAIEFPWLQYASWQYDDVRLGGKHVGVSALPGYTRNERKILSLGVIDSDIPDGTDVTFVWGEPGGDASKPQVEEHRQTEIRATVHGVPYSNVHFVS